MYAAILQQSRNQESRSRGEIKVTACIRTEHYQRNTQHRRKRVEGNLDCDSNSSNKTQGNYGKLPVKTDESNNRTQSHNQSKVDR